MRDSDVFEKNTGTLIAEQTGIHWGKHFWPNEHIMNISKFVSVQHPSQICFANPRCSWPDMQSLKKGLSFDNPSDIALTDNIISLRTAEPYEPS